MLREVATGMGMSSPPATDRSAGRLGLGDRPLHRKDEALDYRPAHRPGSAAGPRNAPGNRGQQVGDWVVFDASLIYPAPEDEEERKRFVPHLCGGARSSSGSLLASELAGGRQRLSGRRGLRRLPRNARRASWKVWVHSNHRDYQVTDASSGEELRAIYFTVATPAQQAPRDLHQALQEATEQWPHRVLLAALASGGRHPAAPGRYRARLYGL